MTNRFACLLTVVLGALTLKLTLSGEYLNYVRAGMYPWLLVSGLFLAGLGIVGWLSARKGESHSHDDCEPCDDGHSHHGLSKAAWLLILPILAATLSQPAPLGSFAANRQASRPPRPPAKSAVLAQEVVRLKEAAPDPAPAAEPAPTEVAGIPMPASSAAAEMSLLDFLEITYYDETKTLAGVPVTLVGFVMPAEGGRTDEFLLSRFMISCCAADAQLMQAGVTKVSGPVPKADTWVAVTGTWQPDGPEGGMSSDGFPIPRLEARKMVPVPQPANPYLSLTRTRRRLPLPYAADRSRCGFPPATTREPREVSCGAGPGPAQWKTTGQRGGQARAGERLPREFVRADS